MQMVNWWKLNLMPQTMFGWPILGFYYFDSFQLFDNTFFL